MIQFRVNVFSRIYKNFDYLKKRKKERKEQNYHANHTCFTNYCHNASFGEQGVF
jgi:hypothetical protein